MTGNEKRDDAGDLILPAPPGRGPGPTAVLYLVLLILAGSLYALIGRPEPEPQAAWLAARDLESGRQIRAQDLKPANAAAGPDDAAGVGRHLIAALKKNDPLLHSNLTDAPALGLGDGDLAAFLWPTADELSLLPFLEPGVSIRICSPAPSAAPDTPAPPACGPEAPILIVHTARSEGDKSWIAIQLRSDRLSEWSRLLTAEKRTLVIASP